MRHQQVLRVLLPILFLKIISWKNKILEVPNLKLIFVDFSYLLQTMIVFLLWESNIGYSKVSMTSFKPFYWLI